jgi:membrane-associated protein
VTESLLALIPAWGAALLALVTFASCVALPVPASLMMLAGGAFAAAGDLELATLVLAAWAGAILGDQTGFHLGAWVEQRLGKRAATKALAARARDLVSHRPRFAIFITRWLLSPLGPYANIAAGAAGMNWLTFTLAAALGEAVWVTLYVGLGYAFGSEYDRIATLASNLSGLLASGFVAWLIFRRFGRRPARGPAQ